MPTRRSPFSVVIAGVILAACSDSATNIVPVDVSTPATSPVALASQTLNCSANVPARTVSCMDAQAGNVSRSPIIVGGQNVYVKLTSSNLVYNSGTGSFAFDVTVQNLAPQAMGTSDGTTGDGTGINVFFQQLPVLTSGSGAVTVTNATGTNGTFLQANQTFYTYPGNKLGGDNILSQGETSSTLNWQFNVPASVTTFSFSVYVSANVAAPNGYITLTSSPSMMAAASQALSATVKSAVGNTIVGQTVSFGTSDAAVATVASDGTVTGVGPGTATITATSTTRSGTAAINVCPTLALGGVYEFTGTAAASFCLGGMGAGQEYVVIPYNGDNAASVALSVTASNLTAVSGNPSPSMAPGDAITVASLFQPTRDYSFEKKLRNEEIALARQLGGQPARSRSRLPGATGAITPGVPLVGATMSLNMLQNACSTSSTTATVKSVGTHIIIMEDNTNPPNQPLTSEYDAMAATFDNLVYPAVTAAFGTPNDIDNNGGRVIAVFTAAVNDLTPSPSSSYVGGYFYSRDLYTAGVCAGSNVGEMFYMLAMDSLGAHGNVRSSSLIKSQSVGTMGHEFQHLINASRRNLPTNEDSWLNEGMSHIAEEKIYYAATSTNPGGNIAYADIHPGGSFTQSYNDYSSNNIGRLYSWLAAPDANAATDASASLAQRGSAWAFLRYALDRKGGTENTLLAALAGGPDIGRTNLTNRLGTSMDTWLKDFVVAAYADDAGISAGSTYLMPSWNFRDIYPHLNYGSGFVYALKTADPTSGVGQSLTLAANGVGYVRLGVGASVFSTVSVAKSGGGALPSNLSVMVLRRK